MNFGFEIKILIVFLKVTIQFLIVRLFGVGEKRCSSRIYRTPFWKSTEHL